MKRIVIACALIGSTGVALGATLAIPPGGPAPKPLLGTWRTTLTRADIARASNPAHMPAQMTWELVLANGKYMAWPRALGLRPAGQGGDTAPFGFSGSRLFIQCLGGDQGSAVPGHGTYAWSLRDKSLRFKLVSEPCKDRDLRNRIVILTSQRWTRVS